MRIFWRVPFTDPTYLLLNGEIIYIIFITIIIDASREIVAVLCAICGCDMAQCGVCAVELFKNVLIVSYDHYLQNTIKSFCFLFIEQLNENLRIFLPTVQIIEWKKPKMVLFCLVDVIYIIMPIFLDFITNNLWFH